MTELRLKRAFYAGSFDPLTNGHLGILYQALAIFDHVVLAVGRNPNKKEMFPIDKRVQLIHQVVAADPVLREAQERLTVTTYEGQYLVTAAIAHDCGTLVRGVRNDRDREDEALLATLNHNLCIDLGLPQLQTRLFAATHDKVPISSTMVKAMLGFAGWEKAVERYVPATVLQALIAPAEINRSLS